MRLDLDGWEDGVERLAHFRPRSPNGTSQNIGPLPQALIYTQLAAHLRHQAPAVRAHPRLQNRRIRQKVEG